MSKIVIQDTADVMLSKLTGDKKVVLNAENQLSNISGTINEEDLRGGIGNKKIFKIRSDKSISLTMRSAVADPEYWAMTQGVDIEENGKATVTKSAKVTVTDDGGVLKVKIPNTTVTEARLNDKDDTQEEVTVTNGEIEIPVGFELQEGDSTFVFWKEEVQGKRISIDATKYSQKYRCEMRTIAYDVDTAEVIADIYFIFPEVLPSGEWEISLENGTVYTPEISFDALNPIGSDEIGEILIVPRNQ